MVGAQSVWLMNGREDGALRWIEEAHGDIRRAVWAFAPPATHSSNENAY